MASSSKKIKITRQYKDEYLLLGFRQYALELDKPECIECGALFSNDYMKKSKLETHQQRNYPESVGRDRAFFSNHDILTKVNAQLRLSESFTKMQQKHTKTLIPSYLVAQLIAKAGAPISIGETLIKPAMEVCAKELLGSDAANALMRIPLSNDTIRRRQDEMSNQLEDTLINNLRRVKFSLHIDESTMHNISLLLAYVRYFEGHTICEEMLFIKVLPSHVTGEVLYDVTKGYFDKNNIPLVNLVQVATDGAPAMRGQHKGFVSRMKEAAPHILTIIVLFTGSIFQQKGWVVIWRSP